MNEPTDFLFRLFAAVAVVGVAGALLIHTALQDGEMRMTLQATHQPPAVIPQTAVEPTPELPDRAIAIVRSLGVYRKLQQSLDREMPDALIKIDGKPYRTKAYWSAVALALGIDVELESEERINIDGDRTVQVMYRASLGGRSAQGDGACSFSEVTRPTFHTVRARAHTRGRNRAIAILVAFGEVSAEELAA